MDTNIFETYGGGRDLIVHGFSDVIRGEITFDSIIPDTVADVETVLLCTVSPRMDGYYIANRYLIVEGTADCCVLLRTEDGNLVNHRIREPFELKSECNLERVEDGSLLSIRLDSASAVLLNPRKLKISASLYCDTKLFSSLSYQPTVTGTDSIEDDMNLQRIHRDVSSLEVLTVNEKDIAVSQDLELDGNEPPMAEILSCRVNLCTSDVRINDGEAHVRSDVMVSILYRSEEGNCFSSEKRFVTEHLATLPSSAAVEWMAHTVPMEVSAQISANSYGEMKILELDFTYQLMLTVLSNRSIRITTDMFSTEYECVTESCDAKSAYLYRIYNTGLSVNASITRDDANAPSVRGILTGNVNVKTDSVHYMQDKNKLLVEGVADIALIGENPSVDESASPVTPITFTYPFRCELDATDMPREVEFLLDCKLSGYRFRVDSGRIYADLELAIRIAAIGIHEVSYVGRISLDRGRPVTRMSAPITLCYPSGKETLWDIAKYYKITEESILSSNELTDSDISGRKVLLIPRHEPQKPVLSKVI